jgi:peptide/nickel transport system substrate-binding protein
MKRMVGLAVLGLFWAGTLAQAQTITVGQGADAVTLDPHGTNDQPSARVMRQIYDTLIIQQEDLELVPGLAESWEQLDDTTWEFTLREGVTFHNGEPLTADDVVFTFNRLIDPEVAAPAAFLLGFVESVEAADERTVRITTQYPFAPILAHLSHTATSILNEQAVTEAGEDYGTTTVVGTGPFSFVRWEPATQIVLERNDDWWGGEVLPERVVFRPIIEGTVRAIELETGGIDIAYGLEPTDANRIEGGGVPGVRLETVETLSTNYIGFNVQKEPFDDPRVRQAINHAVDVDLIIEAVLEGRAIPATGPIAPAVFGARTDLEPYAYDPERARELLAEAGYEDGFSTTIWTNDNPTRIQIAEIVQAMLLDVGINVDVQVLEWGTYLADTAEGLHDMFILGWVSVTGDADYGLYSLFHSEQMGNPGNRTFYANERVDELLDLGRSSADEEERLAAYAEAQEIILEEAPWIFLNITVEDNGVRDNVEGFVPHPAGHHRLHSVTIAGS